MKRWQLIQAGIVTPKGNLSAVDAPAVLLNSFTSLIKYGDALEAHFDRSLPTERAAYRSCDLIREAVDQTLKDERRPLLLGGECSLIAGSLSSALDRIPNLHLAFFDAHGDFNTPETSPSQYLGGMCFAHVCGLFNPGLPWRAARAFSGERALLVGGRELDSGEDANLRRAGVLQVNPSAKDLVERLREAVGRAPLWIHVDLDVVDPSENFAVSHPVAGGISFARLQSILAQLAASNEVCGIEVCGYLPASDPERALPARIADAIAPLLGVAS
jgi:arginase/N-omega-hydroxy-L-arginine amidinohydrolase